MLAFQSRTYHELLSSGIESHPGLNAVIERAGQLSFDIAICSDGPKRESALIIVRNDSLDVPGFTREITNIEIQLKEVGCKKISAFKATDNDFDSITQHLASQSKKSGSFVSPDSENKTYFNSLILKAVNAGASDIHFYTFPNGSGEINFDINDRPRLIDTRTREFINALINSALSSGGENYSGTGAEFEIADDNIDHVIVNDNGEYVGKIKLRISKTGTSNGIHCVIRVGRTSDTTQSFEQLGIAPDVISIYRTMSNVSSGIFILSGPTATGKTTTLNAFYECIDESRKVVLLGDPIEAEFKRKHMVLNSVNTKKEGFGYEEFIEASLRQAPKVIGIAEVRTAEVLQQVFQIALTGHFVATTYHAEDAFSALLRLLDDGIEPHKLGSGLLRAVGSQRLLSKLCKTCRKPVHHAVFGDVFTLNPDGCSDCEQGATGRINVSEVLVLDSVINDMLSTGNIAAAKKHAKDNGFKNMADRTMPLIKRGEVCLNQALATVPHIDSPTVFKYPEVEL